MKKMCLTHTFLRQRTRKSALPTGNLCSNINFWICFLVPPSSLCKVYVLTQIYYKFYIIFFLPSPSVISTLRQKSVFRNLIVSPILFGGDVQGHQLKDRDLSYEGCDDLVFLKINFPLNWCFCFSPSSFSHHLMAVLFFSASPFLSFPIIWQWLRKHLHPFFQTITIQLKYHDSVDTYLKLQFN